MPRSLLGRWVGGPYNSTVVMEMGPQGVQGRFKTPSGQWGTIQGLLIGGGSRVKGTYVDPDGGHSRHKDDQRVDMRLGSDGVSWTASVTADGVRVGDWSGRKPKWRGTSKTTWYKNKESWERLLKPSLSNTPEWLEQQRKKVMVDSMDESGRKRRNGLLCESAPLATGEAYRGKSATRSSRHRGRTFVAGKSRFATTNVERTSGVFSEPQPLAVGDVYEDATVRRRRAMAERRVKDEKFDRPKFAPAAKRPTRNMDPGFLTSVDKHTDKATMEALLEEAAKKKVKPTVREVTIGPKNFLTNPTRRGHYAQPGALLGHKTDDGKKLFEHKSDPYTRQEELRRAENRRRRERLEKLDRKPWCSSSSKYSRVFNKDAEVYKGVGPGGPPPKRRPRPQSAPSGGRVVKEPEEEERPRWVPTNPGKRGQKCGTFGGNPEYIPDPAPPVAMRPRESGGDDAAWKPNPTGNGIRPVVPVMTSRVNLRKLMYPQRPVRSWSAHRSRGATTSTMVSRKK